MTTEVLNILPWFSHSPKLAKPQMLFLLVSYFAEEPRRNAYDYSGLKLF
jgi:hypothetical protein